MPEERQRVSRRDRLALFCALMALCCLAAGGALFSWGLALVLPGIGFFVFAVLIGVGV